MKHYIVTYEDAFGVLRLEDIVTTSLNSAITNLKHPAAKIRKVKQINLKPKT